MDSTAPSASDAGPSSVLQADHDVNDPKGKRRLSHGRGPLLGDSDDDSLSPDERTALLPSPASKKKRQSGAASHNSKPTWRRIICWVVAAIVLVLIALLITLHVLLGHLWARRLRDEEQMRRYGQRALVLEGPDELHIDSFDDDGIHGRVAFRAGIDVLKAFDGEKPLDFVERRLIRWGLDLVPEVHVALASPVRLESQDARLHLADVMPSDRSFALPVRWHPEDDWLHQIEQPFHIRITEPEDVATFLNESWEKKRADLRMVASEVAVSAASSLFSFSKSIGVREEVGSELPDLPGLGHLSDLVNLQSYSIAPLAGRQLGLSAKATALNPLSNATLPAIIERLLKPFSDMPLDIPWRLPFSVSIRGTQKSEIPMAQVSVQPFALAQGFRQPSVELTLSGIFSPETNASNEALSTFLARFLLGLDNPVVVKYSPVDAHRAPPAFLTPLLAQYPVQLRFPGAPDDERHLLQDVKIENMRISLGDGTSDLRASGRVVGQLKLPKELAGLADAEALAIRAVMPDVYVYDGTPPPSRERGSVPGDGRPPASNAFARLRSATYLPAKTERAVDDKGRNVTLVHAQLDNAPLDLLPGRSDIFRRYMGKVLFGSGTGPEGKVRTGVKGICAVNATIEGFGRVELSGLPVEGDFYVGKGDAGLSDFIMAGLWS